MTPNSFSNALFALAYIVALVSAIMSTPVIFPDFKDNLFTPMGMLALLVLSVALMAYLFFYQPVIMLLDGKREQAVRFFLRTVGIFAGGTVLIFFISLIVSRI